MPVASNPSSTSARMVRQMVCKKSQISGPSFSSTYSRSEIYRQRQYCAISANEFSGYTSSGSAASRPSITISPPPMDSTRMDASFSSPL